MDLDAKVAFLSQPRNYCHPVCPSGVEVIQTHMSWVFMTDREVYKLKKPVRFSFLDFSTLEARHRDSLEEVRLNRRLAPDVYLGVQALRQNRAGQLQLDVDGEPVEWLVRMRRLPAGRMLDHAIRAGTVEDDDVHRITRVLADFYRRAAPVPMRFADYRQRLRRDIEINRRELLTGDAHLPRARIEALTDAQFGFLDQAAELLEARCRERRIIEAHGDLRPEHVCLTPTPVFIDCLEFNRAFRLLDPADELAFLAMECEYAGAAFIGPLLFATYDDITGDTPPASLIAFHKSCRATLRARLAFAHLQDHGDSEHPRWIEKTRGYLDLAEQYSRCL
ncbi:hypothetical protein D6C00_02780 [Thiohalobacter thiocyanaticus]|uniref:Aminoglycoside phosphotransferase domain-containing protein n=1 Tax=Thiohalobacter thiocyanaticus TaxID=585455 RepID=A0A426QMK5_9GAMM|nr:hypothetical protein D6C00_02780 [Thiohalobacter thiocyanaticus]